MQHALVQAEKAYEAGEVPVGAVVVFKNRIIGRGYNQREQLNDPTAHAEIIAITAAASTLEDWRLNDCFLFGIALCQERGEDEVQPGDNKITPKNL